LTVGVFILKLLFAADDALRFDCFVASAAFGVEEAEEFLKSLRVRGPEECTVAADGDEFFVFEFFEVVRERGGVSRTFLVFHSRNRLGISDGG
jgi:hypothetical protein